LKWRFRRSRAGTEVFQGTHVAAHLVGHLLAGDVPVAQLEHGRIPVPPE